MNKQALLSDLGEVYSLLESGYPDVAQERLEVVISEVSLMNDTAALSWAAWVSVDERLPEPGNNYLVYRDDCWDICYFGDSGQWYDSSDFVETPSHWMKLPPAPARETKETQ